MEFILKQRRGLSSFNKTHSSLSLLALGERALSHWGICYNGFDSNGSAQNLRWSKQSFKEGRGLQSQYHLFKNRKTKQNIFTGRVPAQTGKTRAAKQSPTNAPLKGALWVTYCSHVANKPSGTAWRGNGRVGAFQEHNKGTNGLIIYSRRGKCHPESCI